MSDTEILGWAGLLHDSRGGSQTVESTRSIIMDLLRHKDTDQMSDEDQGICARALVLIDEGQLQIREERVRPVFVDDEADEHISNYA